ncbi:hypothetical protein, partial [Mesorhizobium sp. M2E.F.Ca.ET.154.01.1.1]
MTGNTETADLQGVALPGRRAVAGIRIDLNTMMLLAILLVAAIARFHNITQPLVDAFSWRETST